MSRRDEMLERCGFSTIRRIGDQASRVMIEAKP
jgi:hypothetical protein